jgi:phospholipid N-methyltransferase
LSAAPPVPATNGTRSRSEQLLLFGRNFLKHPKMLGSLIPSSRFLVGRLLDEVDWPRAQVVVEYGPGVGTFTGEILRRLPKESALVAIETNRDFVRYLDRTVRDDRLHLVHGSAAEAGEVLARRNLARADYVISGIPYTTMPAEIRQRILETTHEILHPTGAFLVYQFTRAVLPYLREVFGTVHQEFEPRNIMPARLFYCRPQAEEGAPARTAHDTRSPNGKRNGR